jgi:hypothetical protein
LALSNMSRTRMHPRRQTSRQVRTESEKTEPSSQQYSWPAGSCRCPETTNNKPRECDRPIYDLAGSFKSHNFFDFFLRFVAARHVHQMSLGWWTRQTALRFTIQGTTLAAALHLPHEVRQSGSSMGPQLITGSSINRGLLARLDVKLRR